MIKIVLNCSKTAAAEACGMKRTTLVMKLKEPEKRIYASDLAAFIKAEILQDVSVDAFLQKFPVDLSEGSPVQRAGTWKALERMTGIPRSTFREKLQLRASSGSGFREFKISELQRIAEAHLINQKEVLDYLETAYRTKKASSRNLDA